MSYFMLAEEMTVVTREVFPDGVVAPHVAAGGDPQQRSLFRIQQQTDPTEDDLPEGGTRVRLYLRQDADLAELSCVTTLDRHVAVSEFAMEARDGHLAEEWVADVLRPGPWNADGDAQRRWTGRSGGCGGAGPCSATGSSPTGGRPGTC
ncbi:hypothetical protein [Kitasatospora albolonga]|uniref:hypothetical protein n=1 Tax=Kitasatospora albolonga TaxID=68173 RepID=UPI0031E4EE99